MKKKLSLNEEIVLSCAMRYALGRMSYVVSSVCSELRRHYEVLPESFKERVAREIREYQEEYCIAGMKMDDDEWNKVKWLFDETNRVEIEANYHNTDRWERLTAIKAENGKYYSIPDMKEYHTVREATK